MTCVATVATKERISSGEIFSFLKFTKELGIDEVTIFEPAPTGNLSFSDSVILGEKERNILKKLHKRANSDQDEIYPRIFSFPYIESSEFMGCGAGFNRLHITALGEVMPCDFTPITFGNITRENIVQIWDKMQAFFKKPHKDCFILKNFKTLRETYQDNYTITNYHLLVEKNKGTAKREELPEFYRNLMSV